MASVLVGDTIACANQKGGVGKTTTVVNLATYLALERQRVLVVDVDPQGNATSGFGLDKRTVRQSVYEALVGDDLHVRPEPTGVPGLFIVPASRELAGAEVELVSVPGRERRLRRALEVIGHGYDFVLLDCPPSLGLLTLNALTAADRVLVPIQCEFYALEGLSQLLATIELVREHLNPALELEGVVLTMFDGRTTLSADVSEEVRRHLGDRVFESVVPRSVRLAEAPSYGRPIAMYSPQSRGAEAYRSLAQEVLKRHQQRLRATTAPPALPPIRTPRISDTPHAVTP